MLRTYSWIEPRRITINVINKINFAGARLSLFPSFRQWTQWIGGGAASHTAIACSTATATSRRWHTVITVIVSGR